MSRESRRLRRCSRRCRPSDRNTARPVCRAVRTGSPPVAVGRHREFRRLAADRNAHSAIPPAAAPLDARAVRSRAGSSISRSYQKRTRSQAASISASSRAKSIAPAQRASAAPADPASIADLARRRKQRQERPQVPQQAQRLAQLARASRRHHAGRASAASASAVSRRSILGRAAARSRRYCTMNSTSTRPPRPLPDPRAAAPEGSWPCGRASRRHRDEPVPVARRGNAVRPAACTVARPGRRRPAAPG